MHVRWRDRDVSVPCYNNGLHSVRVVAVSADAGNMITTEPTEPTEPAEGAEGAEGAEVLRTVIANAIWNHGVRGAHDDVIGKSPGL